MTLHNRDARKNMEEYGVFIITINHMINIFPQGSPGSRVFLGAVFPVDFQRFFTEVDAVLGKEIFQPKAELVFSFRVKRRILCEAGDHVRTLFKQ